MANLHIKVRHAQNEIRLLQQQNASIFSSPSMLHNGSPNANINHHESFIDSKLTGNLMPKKLSTVTMRRGVLMSILQQAALTLPLWVGEIGQHAPSL